MFKVGGARPDPSDIQYTAFNKASFDGHDPLSSGDVDLRPFSSPRHNQRQTSTCVAQSTIKALEIKRIQKHGIASHVPLSVMDLYYGARDAMSPKETNVDEGTNIYLACQVLRTFGVCREQMNPFDEKNLFIPTPLLASREAYLNRTAAERRIDSTGWDRVDDVVANLRMGNPVVFATQVGNNWFNYGPTSKPLEPTKPADSKGGHAMCLVGWVDNKFIVENSWGTEFGQNGFAFVQPEVISDANTNDLWSILDGSEAYFEGNK